MTKRPSRGLADISHYFITEKKEETAASPKVEPAAEISAPAPAVVPRHLFLLGAASSEARALVACNLACEWSRDGLPVEVVEGETKIPNAHFLMGSLFPENGESRANGHPLVLRLDGARALELSSWNHRADRNGDAPKRVLWNIPLTGILKEIKSLPAAPSVLVILEPEKKKLMETYLELRQAAAARPDARFGALVYLRGSDVAAGTVFSFFSEMAAKFLRVPLHNCGELRWNLHLAKSILARMPAVLQPETKEEMVFLGEILRFAQDDSNSNKEEPVK